MTAKDNKPIVRYRSLPRGKGRRSQCLTPEEVGQTQEHMASSRSNVLDFFAAGESLNVGDAKSDDDGRRKGGVAPADLARRARRSNGDHPAREELMHWFNRYVLYGHTNDQLAAIFGVSLTTIRRWKNELKARWSKTAASVSANSIIGESIAFYDEVRSSAMMRAAVADTPGTAMRFVEIALKAEMNKHQMLILWGVPEKARFEPSNEGYKPADDAREMRDFIKQIVGEKAGVLTD